MEGPGFHLDTSEVDQGGATPATVLSLPDDLDAETCAPAAWPWRQSDDFDSKPNRQELDAMIREARFKSSVSHELQLPWETPSMAGIFGKTDSPIVPKVMQPPEGIVSTIPGEPKPLSSFQNAFEAAVKFESGRSKHLQEGEQFALIFQRWELVLAHNLDGSMTGRQISSMPQTERVEYVASCLGGKSLSTLRKRLGQVQRYFRWGKDGVSEPLIPISSKLVRAYVQYLRDAAGYSAVVGFLELTRFLRHVLGVYVEEGADEQPFVRGVVRSLGELRPPRRQARPLQCTELAFLERFIDDPKKSMIDRYGIGVCLFAVYARARIGDLRPIEKLALDTNDDFTYGYLEAHSTSHKMRRVGNRLGLPLPLIAPLRGVTEQVWVQSFVTIAHEVGLDLDGWRQGNPLLPAPDRLGRWTQRATTSEELGSWLRAVLEGGGFANLDKVTGRSCKATTLSHLAKWGADEPTRAILGHHSSKGKSVFVYSRDQQAAPLRVLERCLSDIRKGVFLPDATRSGMMIENASISGHQSPERCDKMSDKADTNPDHQSTSSSSSEETSSQASDDTLIDAMVQHPRRPPIWKQDCDIYQHSRTKKLHLLGSCSTQSFVCGRAKTSEYALFSKPIMAESWKCIQCDKGNNIRTANMVAAGQACEDALKRLCTR